LAIANPNGSGTVGIACAQLAPRLGDAQGNRDRAVAAIERAARAGAQLVVLPELSVSGYVFADQDEAARLAEPLDGPAVTGWLELSARHGLVIVAGLCELGPPLSNTAVVIDDGRLLAAYRKTHLWDREQEIFERGSAPPPVLDTSAGRLGVAVCYDAFFPEVMRDLALRGADVIAVPMNSPVIGEPLRPLAAELVLAIAAAHTNRVFVAQCDRTGTERGVEWAQASVIVDPDGSLLAGPMAGEQVLTASCDLTRARDKSLGERNDVLADRRPELYDTAPVPTPTSKENP
jgi:predicted amidohydrolase